MVMIDELVGFSAFGFGFVIVALSVLMVIRYDGTKTLRASFILLATAFVFYSIAELLWYLLDLQGIEPYQNWPDLFYTVYFIFAIAHVIKTIKFFKAKGFFLTPLNKIQLMSFVGVASVLYIIYASGSSLFDLLYGLAFVILAATLASATIIGVIRVQNTKLGNAWLLIGVSIILASVLDICYYMLEVVNGYEYGQYVFLDIGWLVSDILIVIGIIIHRRTI